MVLVLVLVLKDSLRTYFKSLSLSWSLGVRSLSLSLRGQVQEVLVLGGQVLVLVLGGQILVLVLVLGGQVLVNIPACMFFEWVQLKLEKNNFISLSNASRSGCIITYHSDHDFVSKTDKYMHMDCAVESINVTCLVIGLLDIFSTFRAPPGRRVRRAVATPLTKPFNFT